jgi:hypothetical protein
MNLLLQQVRGWQQAVAVTVKIGMAEVFARLAGASREGKAAAEERVGRQRFTR